MYVGISNLRRTAVVAVALTGLLLAAAPGPASAGTKPAGPDARYCAVVIESLKGTGADRSAPVLNIRARFSHV
jgi:hypothetical protein